ncbi:MAG TPA: 1-acyl-sn-glycerol-3-phosphate acyltransferase [Thermoanaerobaculia bacterium]|jgi:glycerol-3-phosphate O-acyltransferase
MLRIEIAVAVLVIIAIVAYLLGKRHARRLQHARRIRIDRFKLKQRHADIALEVFGSREVVAAVQAYAKEHHVTTEAAMKQARIYLQEIVPKFNLLAYYRVGAPVAKGIMYFLYRPVVERTLLRVFNDRAPKDAVVVYVINHRSNADYVLVAHMLFEFISLSYAVGEWARVWPLNHLFKWFGAYFVRRRYREPLYHAVLSSFVGTITRNGVTQGIFIEGGLSRDGAFLKPKLGMLDYIVQAKRNPEFTEPLFIIPTAINYDRVLEDRNLTQELLGREDRSTKSEKLRTTFDFLFRNFWRGVFRRFKRYGYAIVSFGEPIDVDTFIRNHPAILSPDFEQRKGDLRALADSVMDEISAALPITPVTLAARIFSESRDPLTDDEMIERMDGYRERWRDRVWLLREKNGEEMWRRAKWILELRHLIEPAQKWRSDLFAGEGVPVVEEAWQWNPAEILIRDYYANSLMSFAEVKQRGWPERDHQKLLERVV